MVVLFDYEVAKRVVFVWELRLFEVGIYIERTCP